MVMICKAWIGNVEAMTDRQTNKQTDRISTCRLDPSGRRGRVKSGSNVITYFLFAIDSR